MDRYHKAARDGLCEVLKEASKKEINAKDGDGMTPLLYAAFEGKLDAMKLLIGRGGDPDKTDQFGNSALHLSSAKGHVACVDYLVKYGANIFALDIDNHNPKQLAAINNRDDILNYLDAAIAHLEATDKKKAFSMKEKAKKTAEKRIKEFVKRQQKTEREDKKHRSSMLGLRKVFGSHGNLSTLSDKNHDTKFSDLVGGNSGGTMVPRGAAERKKDQLKLIRKERQFKIGERVENGSRTLRNIEGLVRDSEVMYVGTFQNNNMDKRVHGRITDVFGSNAIEDVDRNSIKRGTISAWRSQPDLTVSSADIAEDMKNQRPMALFDRQTLGGALSVGHSVTSALSSSIDQASNHSSSESGRSTKQHEQSIKNRHSSRHQQLLLSDSEEDEDGSDASQNSSDNDDADDSNKNLKRFLAAYSLEQHYDVLLQQQISLDDMMILTEEDLRTLNLPLGPFRRLIVAIDERKVALKNPGAIIDSRL